MKLLVMSDTVTDFDHMNYVVINLDSDLLETIRRRRALYEMVKAQDANISELTFSGEYHEWYPSSAYVKRINAHGDDELVEQVEERLKEESKEICELLDGTSSMNFDDYEVISEPDGVECEVMILDQYSVQFRCLDEHVDVASTSHMITYASLFVEKEVECERPSSPG